MKWETSVQVFIGMASVASGSPPAVTITRRGNPADQARSVGLAGAGKRYVGRCHRILSKNAANVQLPC